MTTMQIIFKYELPSARRFELLLPRGHRILSVQEQHGVPQLWVLLDIERQGDLTPRVFRIAMTGDAVDLTETPVYVDTFQMGDGTVVLHLFMELEHAE
jgi:hypothetical protein